MLMFLHKFDIFAKPITLNYAGKGAYSTKCGGVVGLLVYLTLIVFTGTRVNKLVKRQNPQVYEISTGLDLDLGLKD